MTNLLEQLHKAYNIYLALKAQGLDYSANIWLTKADNIAYIIYKQEGY
jgi:hypothetical protein